MFEIDIQPIGKRASCSPEQTLLESIQRCGIDLTAVCGGTGSCGHCQVRFLGGVAPSQLTTQERKHLSEEKIAAGWRLACQVKPQGDLRIEIPPESLTAVQRTQVEGSVSSSEIQPGIQVCDIDIPSPNAQDLRSDLSRLRECLAPLLPHPLVVEPPLIQDLSRSLRDNAWRVRLSLDYSDHQVRVAGVHAPNAIPLGLAFDIGTTKIAAYLVDLQQGTVLSQLGAMNPQIAFGEDVITRIAFSNRDQDGSAILQQRLVGTLNQMVTDLCQAVSLRRDQIVAAVVVGNTAEHHFFCGLPVRQLGQAPYLAAVTEAIEIPAREVGLQIAKGARVYLPPNIAGFVGADHTAMLLASGAWKADKPTIAMDIGTNTEISLINRGHITSCSCASGPAFEGAHIKMGMRAAAGAIESVRYLDGAFQYQTIDRKPPLGFCGSGILDATAALLHAQVIDFRGVMRKDIPGIRVNEQKRVEFIMFPAAKDSGNPDIVVTRDDINQIQLAKAAISSGVEVLLNQAGITTEDINDFILAGAFGSYIAIESAIDIGMLPPLPRSRFRQIGNAAGAGARQLLLSVNQRHLIEEFSRTVEYIELTTLPFFTQCYMQNIFLHERGRRNNL